jgi:hypothetical protein
MMPKTNRLSRRFFTVLISLSIAFCLPRAGFGSTKLLAPTLCQISDTVYRADGSPAQGTVLISWQAFTTSAGQAVSPGSLLVTLDASGGFNASLAPNTGAQPAGTYYKAIFKLNDGTTETEYWVVPNTQTTTIGAIRSKLVPAQQAAQFLTRDVADSVYVSLASTQNITGTKTFSVSPAVPTPQNPTDAANKSYVDANSGSGNLASPPPIGNVTPNTVNATVLSAANVNGVVNPAAYYGGDWSTATNAAIAAAPAGSTIDMRGFSAAELAIPGSATIVESKKVHVIWPVGNLTLNGCPGINVTTTDAVINEGQGWYYSYNPTRATGGTELISGSACPLIQDETSIGGQWLNLSLNGNGVGTVGILSQSNGGSGYLIRDIHIHHFRYAGAILPGTGSFDGRFMINNNGGDGILTGSAPTINGGDAEIVANGGNGIHSIGEGPFFTAPNVDYSGLNGLYFDGRIPQPWVANTNYVSPSLLKPASSPHNAGNFYFYSENVNCKTGSGAEPAWPQTIGSTVTDGTCIWVNLGSFNGGIAPNVGEAMGISLSNPQVIRSGNTPIAGYTPANIRLEGAAPSNPTCGGYDVLSGVLISMGAAASTNNPDGLHLLNCAGGVVVDGYTYTGNSSSNSSTSADGYGLVIENSYDILVSNYYAYWSTKSPVRLINTSASQLTGVGALCWSNSSVTGNDAYAVQIDGASSTIQITNLLLDTGCGRGNAKGVLNAGPLTYLDNYQLKPNSVLGTLDTLGTATLTNAHGRTNNVPVEFDIAGNPALSIDGNAKVTVASALSFQSIPGVEFLVSKYASIQAAINAAYNNGAVLGTVIDDRTSPYSGAGFILYDSVTLKLAPTTYTISSTLSYNNGHNNVTAGIVLVPGAHLVGAGTSTNHGTILQPGNGLNADLLASSTVGTGTGASVQWWHWGEIGNLRIMGNGANQTSGECLKIENMGETAKVHDVELSACFSNNVEIIGASATQSAISNVTSNLSVGGAGVAFTNLGGVGVLGGVSGDCNHTALIAANFGASGTLEINGLKAEAESSICASQVQDPVILSTTTDSTVLASIKVDGGYAFGNTQHDFVKSTGPGSIQYLQNNFYLTGYTNILNDTVRGQLLPNLSTTIKQPVSYLSNGTIFGNQAFWFQPNTFIQGNPNGTPTELFGLTSSGGALVAAPGNGDNSNPGTGGIQISSYNRSIFGQTPEPMARWGWRFLGSGGGYDTTKWDLVPVWATGDSSDRSIGNASNACQNGSGSVSCRWPHVYALNVDTNTFTLNGNSLATVAASGSYNDLTNKPTIPAQGVHVVSGSMQGPTAQITGTGSQIALYSASIPAGTFAAGAGLKCRAFFHHSTGSANVTMQWKLGSTTWNYPNTFSTGNSPGCQAEIEILTPSALNAETVNVPIAAWGGNYQAPYTGLAWNENLANASTITLNFSVANTDKLTGDTFYCETMQ